MKYIRRDSPGVVTDRWPSEGRPSGRGAEGGAVAVRRTAVGGGTHAGLTIDHFSASSGPARRTWIATMIGSMRCQPRASTMNPGGPPEDFPV